MVGGVDGGRLCLRCFDSAGIVRENIAGDALASGTTLQWAPTSKTWQADAVMQESDLNRRQTVMLQSVPVLIQSVCKPLSAMVARRSPLAVTKRSWNLARLRGGRLMTDKHYILLKQGALFLALRRKQSSGYG
jgi:hypothetical protein